QGLVVVRQGLGVVFAGLVDEAAAVEGVLAFGVEAEGLVEVGQGPVGVVLLLVDASAVDPPGGLVGGQPDGVGVVAQGGVQVAPLPERRAAVGVGERVGAAADVVGEVVDGVLQQDGLVLVQPALDAAVPYPQPVALLPEHLVHHVGQGGVV